MYNITIIQWKQNYATEKTEDNNISIDLENKIIKKDSKIKSKKSE